MDSRKWKDNYEKIYHFRKYLKTNFNFPIKQEFHTREFMQDKGDYHGLYDAPKRKQILELFFKLISTLDVKIINVVIDKEKAKNKGRTNYNVLETAFTYATQRLENDMNRNNNYSEFMIITDEGRIQAMREIARKIRKINYIPSQFNPESYRQEIERLIEDPFAKKSEDSYFIQLADTISYITTLYAVQNLSQVSHTWPKRVRQVLNYGDERKLLVPHKV